MNKFEEICRELIKTPIVVVDVGADGGVNEIPNLAPLCEVHAFEPREDSFEQLKPAKTRYAKIFYHNKGLARTSGQHTLFVTRDPRASSLLKPNTPIIKRRREDNALDVVNEIKVDCITLEQFTNEAGINYIDLIKLDTQGSELDILLGGKLENISIITSEVEFVRFYEGQYLFDDMVSELSALGFRFAGVCGTQDTVDKKIIWADCMFIKRTFNDYDSLLKAAMILVEKGYYEDARWIFLDHNLSLESWEKMVNAHILDLHPQSNLIVKINNFLKKVTGGTGLLEVLRAKIGQLLLQSKLGKAAYLIGRNRNIGSKQQ